MKVVAPTITAPWAARADRSRTIAGGDRLIWRVLAWTLIAAAGAVYAWAAQHAMHPDGISYLDLADAFVRGDWSTALNRLWSPLYPLLLAITLWLLRPAPVYEFATVQLLNLTIFLGALASFEFLLSELIRYRRQSANRMALEGRTLLSDWSLRLVGYAAFLYSSLELIPMVAVSPDLTVAMFVYLASGLLLRIRLRPERTRSFAWLGVVLGLGYLAKAPMLPLAFVFLTLAAVPAASGIRMFGVWRRLLAALIPVALIVGALATAFFLTGQGVTVGESGRLNYAWMVNGLPYTHWQGEVPGSGRPVHPTQKIFPSPPVYEFATPVRGTYPLWADPAYWYEGVQPRLDVRSHLQNLARSTRVLLSLSLHMQVLVIGWLLLLYLGGRGRQFLRDAHPYLPLLIPVVPAAGMFSLIWLEPRFIGAFVTLFWLGLFAGITFVESREMSRVVRAVAVAMAAMLLLPALHLSSETVRIVRQTWDRQWSVAQGLQGFGLQPGDAVGVILDPPGAFGAFWARLSEVRIIAEIPACRYRRGSVCTEGHPDAVSAFLAAGEETRGQIIKSFAAAGAKAVVMRNSDHAPLPGWRRIPRTDYDVLLLQQGVVPGESGS